MDTWTLEIFLSVFALGCLASAFAVLLSYNNKPIPTLPFNMTLNTLISIIATGSKLSTFAVVASSIAQVKWIHFRRSARALSDVQVIDDAAYGALGSFWLLLFSGNAMRKSLPAAGALLMIAALPYDPFVQQLITYTQPRPTEDAITTRATAFYTTDDAFFTQAVSNAVYGKIDDFGRHPTCTSGICSWDPIVSLGWCAKCEDMIQQFDIDDCNFAAILADIDPNEPEYNGTCTIRFDENTGAAQKLQWHIYPDNTTDQSSWRYNVDDESIWEVALSTNFTSPNATILNVTWPQLVLGYARLAFLDPAQPAGGIYLSQATQCVLSYCTTTDMLSVTGGLASENRTDPNFGHPFLTDVGAPCWTSDPDIAADHGKTHPFNSTTISVLSRGGVLASEYTFSTSTSPSSSLTFCYDSPSSNNPTITTTLGFPTAPRLLSRAITGTRVTSGFLTPNPILQQPDSDFRPAFNDGGVGIEDGSGFLYTTNADHALEPIAQRMAAAYTDLARNKMVNVTEEVTGRMENLETRISVRWGWGALPLVVWRGAVGFWGWVVRMGRREGVPVWKGSVLAYLYHGLSVGDDGSGSVALGYRAREHGAHDEDDIHVDDTLMKVSEMYEAARETRVKLGEVRERRRMMLLCSSSSRGDA